jgi:hypothetical protein
MLKKFFKFLKNAIAYFGHPTLPNLSFHLCHCLAHKLDFNKSFDKKWLVYYNEKKYKDDKIDINARESQPAGASRQ